MRLHRLWTDYALLIYVIEKFSDAAGLAGGSKTWQRQLIPPPQKTVFLLIYVPQNGGKCTGDDRQ